MKIKLIISILVILAVGFDTFAQEEGLVAHYPIIRDISDFVGNNTPSNYITNSDPIQPFRQDRFGRISAYFIDEIEGNFVEVNTNAVFDLKDGKTIAAWIRPVGLGTASIYEPVISRDWTAGMGNYSIELEYNTTDETYHPVIYVNGKYFKSDAQLKPLDWHHLAYTFSLSSGIIFYLNGEIVDDFSIEPEDLSGSSIYPLRIGADHTIGDIYTGMVDDIRFYDRELSATEIQALAPVEPETIEFNAAGLGNALNFDGDNDYVKINPDLSNQLNGDFTLELWVKPNIPGVERTILDFSFLSAEVFRLTTRKFTMLQIYNVEEDLVRETVNFPTLDNDWSHLTIRLETAKQKLSVFVNGTEVANNYTDGERTVVENPGDPEITTANQPWTLRPELNFGNQYEKFYLGRNSRNENHFNGQLDELRLWNYSRNLIDIENEFYNSVNPDSEGLVTYFTFNQGDGGRDNSAVEGLNELSSGEKQELMNFALNGPTSNFVNSSAISFSIFNVVEISQNVVVGGQEVTAYIPDLDPFRFTRPFVNDIPAEIVERKNNSITFVIPPESEIGPGLVKFATISSESRALKLTVIEKDKGGNFSYEARRLEAGLQLANDIAFIDFNQDGLRDIIALGRNELKVYYQNVDKSFKAGEVVTESGGSAVDGGNSLCVADYDADGLEDIAIATATGPKMLLTQGSNQKFYQENLSTAGYSTSNEAQIGAADIDLDGYTDLVISYVGDPQGGDGAIAYYTSVRGSFFGQYLEPKIIRQQLGIISFDFGDINNDGFLDLVVGSQAESYQGYEYLHNGVDGFEFNKAYSTETRRPESTIISDFDNDGDNDIFFSNRLGQAFWIENENGITNNSASITFGSVGFEALSVDYDGDGDEDLIRSEIDGIYIYEQDGIAQKTFTRRLLADFYIAPRNILAEDFDADGDLDFAVAYEEGVVEIYYHIFSDADFENFQVRDSVSSALIDRDNHTINITVKNNTILTNIVPTFEISEKATITLNGVEQISKQNEVNFTEPLIYNITAEDGTQQEWTARLNPLPEVTEITEVDDFTQTAAEIEWSESSYADYYILEITEGVGGEDTLPRVEVTETEYIASLSAGMNYSVRVKAVNAFGESERYSEKVDFMTIPPNPVLIDSIASTSTTAVIKWLENRGTENYILDVASDSTFSEFASGFDGRSLNTLSETVFGLTPGTKYWVRLSATNTGTVEEGASGFSEILTFVTSLDAAPLAKNATAISSASFTANWDLVSGQDIEYVVEVADDIDFANIVKTETANAASSIEISDLEEGTSQWYRVYAVNANGRSPFSNIIFVGRPLQLSELSVTSEKSRANTEPVPLSFTVRGGQDPYDVIFRYRGVLSTEWEEDSVELAGDVYQYNIENSQFDDIGIEFELVVNDGFNTLRSPKSFIYWNDAESELPSLDLVNEWQIFSIPYQLSDNLIETIFDEMGPFEYSSQWRLVRFDGERYLDAGAGINRIELGGSYWFNTTEDVSIQIENATVNTANTFTLSLNQGWNQVGNPYNVPISWNKVRLSNGIASSVEQVNLYNRQSRQFVEGDIIEAFSGGFIWSDIALEVEISLREDNAASRQINQEVAIGKDIDSDNWLFELMMTSSSGDTLSAPVGIGIHPQAESGKDEFDKMRLPRFIEYTDMATVHPEYFYPYFSRDIKRNESEGSWLFTLSSNHRKELVTLRWSNEHLQGAVRQLWLIDEETGALVNLADEESYEVMLSDAYKISLHYTENRNVKPLPFTIQMGNPYPNPSMGLSTISVLLPKADTSYELLLELFDLNGKKVSTLAQGRFESGSYAFETDFSTLDQSSSAVFFYKLSVNSEIMVKRVILNR
ncbi:Repeat domain-containing protein [Marivirga sericea]|uniref:Repeat domain-containing protein n=1 Tax=Marivirga sericea TaxID=1028 RepID=A0A1X7IL29_9BACT|nr:LamG-like jellyroll fold domain-containing protein [Marivirga sericea]SMG15207.1 Repeat domain-containing protein [Marivirga sericea]